MSQIKSPANAGRVWVFTKAIWSGGFGFAGFPMPEKSIIATQMGIDDADVINAAKELLRVIMLGGYRSAEPAQIVKLLCEFSKICYIAGKIAERKGRVHAE